MVANARNQGFQNLFSEKRLVGERWAQTTGQRFAMVEKMLNDMDMTQQIRAAVR